MRNPFQSTGILCGSPGIYCASPLIYPGLPGIHPALLEIYPGPLEIYSALIEIYPGLPGIHPALLEIYPGPLRIYPALLEIYPGLLRIYPAPMLDDFLPVRNEFLPVISDFKTVTHDSAATPKDDEKGKPQIKQIISTLSSWLLALSKQQARRIILAGFSLFSFPTSLFSCPFLRLFFHPGFTKKTVLIQKTLRTRLNSTGRI